MQAILFGTLNKRRIPCRIDTSIAYVLKIAII
jgi:hypothetical protein